MKNCLIILASLLALSACNTFEGMGKDVQNAGEAITGSAQKTKEKINESK